MNRRLVFALIAAFAVINVAALIYFFADDDGPRPMTAESRFSEHPTRTLDIDGRVFTIEIVSAPEDVRQGLSDRPSMERDHGMLFELGERAIHPFWMNRMHFPIDIIWIDGDTIVEIAENVPPPSFGEIPYTHVPKAEADRVLEVNAGLSRELLLRVGERIEGLTEE